MHCLAIVVVVVDVVSLSAAWEQVLRKGVSHILMHLQRHLDQSIKYEV